MKTVTGENGGRYYVVNEEEGIKLPSVTTVLGKMQDKSGLDSWIARVGEVKAKEISEFSANRGTFMHILHEKYLTLKFIEPTENPIHIAYELAIEECSTLTKKELDCGRKLFFQFFGTRFFNDIKKVLYQEVPVWSFKGGGYAGRMDLCIEDNQGRIKVIDFKSSRKPKLEEWIDGYKMQTSAYSVGLYEQYGIFPHSTEIWISCETGEVQTFTLDQNDIKNYFSKFHELVKKYHETYT